MDAEDQAILDLFQPLWSDLKGEDEYYNRKPLVAHYTSLEVLEKILSNEEIWFSNPLFMNDWEEVRFGIIHGTNLVKQSQAVVKALGTPERYAKFIEHLDFFIGYFEQEHLLDTYIFCLAEHDHKNTDGLLSMWRGYGGNGKGAAIVFDTSKITALDGSALIIARVHYGTAQERITWLEKNAENFASIIAANAIPDDKLYLTAHAVFDRIKLFALFTKHNGFHEEREWRVVYLVDRDPAQKLKPMLHYFNGPRGVEPKLRFKVQPLKGVTGDDLSLEKIVCQIILGPSQAAELTKRSVIRMLEVIKKPALVDRVVMSTIPFRSA